jgi:hypothetical protein
VSVLRSTGEAGKASPIRETLAILFDHLVGAREERSRNVEAEHPRGLQIDHELEFDRPHHRQVGLHDIELLAISQRVRQSFRNPPAAKDHVGAANWIVGRITLACRIRNP